MGKVKQPKGRKGSLKWIQQIVHAEPSSKTEELCRQILSRQKPIYTFESDYNKNLIEMGARPVNMDNVSLWANLFAANVDK